MTPRLTDRLTKLEGAQATQDRPVAMPRAVVSAWMHAMAIGLGSWPRSPSPEHAYARDSLGDGIARALGYRDRIEMDAQTQADPDDWRSRMLVAEQALATRYAAEAVSAPDERAFRIMVGALDEMAAAKRRGVPVSGSEGLERDLPRVVAYFRPAGADVPGEPRA